MTGTSAVIPAAGKGKRLGKGFNKAFAEVAGKPLVAHTLSVFQASDVIDDIILVCGSEDVAACESLISRFGFDKVTAVVEGGEHRQESVYNGLLRVKPEAEIIVIHDGARPFVTEKIITESVSAARLYGAAIAAVPIIDTIKSADDERFVGATIPREQLYAIQTPQTFRGEIILSAHEKALAEGFQATDDAALVERLGGKVKIVPGSADNIKITEPRDLDFAGAKLGGGAPIIRCGFGYDIHRFGPNRRLVLGGVEFPNEEGLEGHSDADVLLHAVCDALLGAASAGDIGRIFPDTDPQYKGISSMRLLSHVGAILAAEDWKIINLDVTLVAQKPRIAAFVEEMRKNISSALQLRKGQISIKATTAEGLGSIGRAEGIACYAVASIVQQELRV
ncbi:MAG: 2-C-methyl-D-erythritol 4-phosphate cytidylyltransferase [Armatimonadota bacterium]|nr:2-C-methyl-D-erythritol 4-phosphate cytidylyltransferase [Armatimonadota bacterium]